MRRLKCLVACTRAAYKRDVTAEFHRLWRRGCYVLDVADVAVE